MPFCASDNGDIIDLRSHHYSILMMNKPLQNYKINQYVYKLFSKPLPVMVIVSIQPHTVTITQEKETWALLKHFTLPAHRSLIKASTVVTRCFQISFESVPNRLTQCAEVKLRWL